MKLDTQNIYAARMLKVLNHVQAHLDEALDLEHLASLAHFSVSHFHRVFKGMLGESIMDHVRRIRMERAYVELSQKPTPVTEVAFAAGYEALESFSRAFRKTFGLSPTQCREQGWTRLFPEAPSGVHYNRGEIVEFILNATGEAVMNVRMETLQELRLITVRQNGPYHDSAARAWGMLCGWAGPKGLLGPTTMFIGISHDDPQVTPPEDIRYDAAITVERDVAVEAPVAAGSLPAGEYAVFTHKGPHEGLEDTYAFIMGRWLPGCGRELRDTPWFEVYRNDPATTPPAQLLTDIHIPLK